MRIYAASASASVTRTLQALVVAGGHSLATAEDAELILCDTIHPMAEPIPTGPRLLLGGAATQGETLAVPLRPQQVLRLLGARKPAPALSLGAGWTVDPLARSLIHATQPSVPLTEKEAALLGTLLQQPSGISREALLAQVWGVRTGVDTHTLETHLYRLRQKLNELDPVPCDIIAGDGSYRIA